MRYFWVLLPVYLAVQLLWAGLFQLVPDESFYWLWTRHLSAGYLDHPPMIAWLMWLGTHAFGTSERGVRVPAVILSAATAAVIVWLAGKVLNSTRAVRWVAVIWLTSPLLATVGLIFTPDMPAIFFSVCGLACATLIARRDDESGPQTRASAGLWLLFGVFCGLALLSKYTSVLLPAGVGMAMLFSRAGRTHLRRPWVYLAAVIALLIFSPVIRWNAQHHWASFEYQLHHGTDVDEEAANIQSTGAMLVRLVQDVVSYVLGQVAAFTPILFVIAVLVLGVFWRRYRRAESTQVDRVLLWTGSLPLLFFGGMMLRAHHYELNWPAFAYFPTSLLIAKWAVARGDGPRRNWLKGGCELALGMLIVLHVVALPAVLEALQKIERVPHALNATSWREYGREIADQARQYHAFVITNRHTDAGEAAFYMPGRPRVWCVGIGSRPTAFDYFDDPVDFAKIPRILWVGRHEELFCRKFGYHVLRPPQTLRLGKGKRQRLLTTVVLERN